MSWAKITSANYSFDRLFAQGLPMVAYGAYSYAPLSIAEPTTVRVTFCSGCTYGNFGVRS